MRDEINQMDNKQEKWIDHQEYLKKLVLWMQTESKEEMKANNES